MSLGQLCCTVTHGIAPDNSSVDRAAVHRLTSTTNGGAIIVVARVMINRMFESTQQSNANSNSIINPTNSISRREFISAPREVVVPARTGQPQRHLRHIRGNPMRRVHLPVIQASSWRSPTGMRWAKLPSERGSLIVVGQCLLTTHTSRDSNRGRAHDGKHTRSLVCHPSLRAHVDRHQKTDGGELNGWQGSL